ncbi:unnamed protein product, partial [Mesorhabditis belari]|uniref:Uncharacterized protein n=1 Tax=Mesorhabditis belari TaxID=2138241 RepID=A0AAF3EVM2_9BILA
MKIIVLVVLSLAVHQINAAAFCPSLPAEITWAPDGGAAHLDYYGTGKWCSNVNGSRYKCYNDGDSDECYLVRCDPLPAWVTSAPTGNADYDSRVDGCKSIEQCFFDGESNKCYSDVCPPLPANITWEPQNVATFDYYEDGCRGTRLLCYNDGVSDACYLPDKGPCPPKPISINWEPENPAHFSEYSDSPCGRGTDCYNDGEVDQCYMAVGKCLPKPDSIFNEPTGPALVGRCPEGFECFHDGSSNQCYCYDTAGPNICLDAHNRALCDHKSNMCAKTCGFCVGPGSAWNNKVDSLNALLFAKDQGKRNNNELKDRSLLFR